LFLCLFFVVFFVFFVVILFLPCFFFFLFFRAQVATPQHLGCRSSADASVLEGQVGTRGMPPGCPPASAPAIEDEIRVGGDAAADASETSSKRWVGIQIARAAGDIRAIVDEDCVSRFQPAPWFPEKSWYMPLPRSARRSLKSNVVEAWKILLPGEDFS